MSTRERIIPIFVPHVGCPNNCVFCNQNKISGTIKPADTETVTRAVENSRRIHTDGSKPQLAFYGGSFTAIPIDEQISLLSAANGYIRSGYIDSIRLSTRPDAIDRDILERLRSFGVKTIEIGAQSLDSEVLLRSGRGHTAEDVFKAAELIKEYGFRLIIQLMTGLPGDTPEKDIKTALEVCNIGPYGVRIYPTVIIRDTALYELWKSGKYKEHTIEDAVEICSRIVPLFEEKGIRIIRLGLNPTDELSSGEAAGGAYHPALGELVRSRIMYNHIYDLLRGTMPGSIVTVMCPAARLSQMIGQHRVNIERLKKEYSLSEIEIKPSEDGRIYIFCEERSGE